MDCPFEEVSPRSRHLQNTFRGYLILIRSISMELRQLRYFIGVCESGGVLPASRMLHIAQPALSQSIAALEAELGVFLFVRTNRGMSLTLDGRTFLEHARVVLADVDRAKNAVRSASTTIRGDVSLGLPTTVALVASLPIFIAARRCYPDIRLKIVESHSGFLGEWLRTGRLDLSVLFPSGGGDDFEHRPLLEERLVMVSHPSQAVKSSEISLTRLAKRPVVLPAKEHGLRRIIDGACVNAGVALDLVGEVDSLPNIKKIVQAKMATTILSPGAVRDEVRSGSLAIATICRPHLVRAISCATSMTRPLTSAASAMVDLVMDEIQKLVTTGNWPARWMGSSDSAY